MKAVEFQSRFGTEVSQFFQQCLEQERTIPLRKMQDITVCMNNEGFELRLETVAHMFSQKFNVNENSIASFYFSKND